MNILKKKNLPGSVGKQRHEVHAEWLLFVKMKALKSSSEEEHFRWEKHIKRPYLASSQGVLALAFNGLPLAQQFHSDSMVSGFWVAACLDKSRTLWCV